MNATSFIIFVYWHACANVCFKIQTLRSFAGQWKWLWQIPGDNSDSIWIGILCPNVCFELLGWRQWPLHTSLWKQCGRIFCPVALEKVWQQLWVDYLRVLRCFWSHKNGISLGTFTVIGATEKFQRTRFGKASCSSTLGGGFRILRFSDVGTLLVLKVYFR